MKKVVLFLMIFAVSALAQHDNAINWGGKIAFGNVFQNTDSLLLRDSGLTDSLYASSDFDTLYSKGLEMPGDGQEGIYYIAAYFDEVSGTSASIALGVRFAYTFYTRVVKNIKWTDWYNIYTCKKDTLYRLVISPSDSTWFQAANYRQYRIMEADADTVLHNVTDFIR